ncbi:MAG: FAD-binding protein [Candidatus Lokiarchaeota archaeon]|nr:FAD-binding protein [Candidatus Lokiarchaeota archaeon]MBD3342634.1 FAD-binding protein [Candidatus Lokiarchaeota archaeon]
MKYNKISRSLSRSLKKIVGKDFFFDDFTTRWTYGFGGTIFRKDWIPDLILMPHSTREVSQIMRLANKNNLAVTARGSGTSLSGGPLTPFGGIVIDLSDMNNIINIDIGNNIVEVEAGVICDDLNEELKHHNYFFPPDPGSSSVCTIGGMVATNAGGIQAFKYGVTKDYVLFLKCVLADGKIVELGSKVLKSVSSYNIKDLLVGSEGTLGVITKIGLRIKPLPKHRKLGFYLFESIEDLAKSVVNLRTSGLVPILLEFLDKTTTKTVFEYLGGEFNDFPKGYLLLADLETGHNSVVDSSFDTLHQIILNNNPILARIAENEEERDKLINARKAALPALTRLSPSYCLEDCTINMSSFAEVINKIEKIPFVLKIPNIKIATFGHMEGNIHPTFLFNENNPRDVIDFEKAIDYLYEEIVIPAGGTVTGEHGIGKIKTPYLLLEKDESVINTMVKIKKLFDPKEILNPGIGKGQKEMFKGKLSHRKLKNQPEKILALNCMRCGFCGPLCVSKKQYRSEAFSPRGRLSILNGIVYGDVEVNEFTIKILHACTLCGQCLTSCPANVPTFHIFEKAREIIHDSSN